MERSKPKTAADRTCSYCNQKGHTRRTCEVKKADIAYMKQYLLDGRKAVAEVCEKHPNLIGKGDMFIHHGNEWRDGAYNDFRRPYVVTSIRFGMNDTQPMVVMKALVPDANGQMRTGVIAKNIVFKGGKKKSEKRRQWEVYSVVDGEQRFTYESLMNGVLDG
jgi:hypothetical protein